MKSSRKYAVRGGGVIKRIIFSTFIVHCSAIVKTKKNQVVMTTYIS